MKQYILNVLGSMEHCRRELKQKMQESEQENNAKEEDGTKCWTFLAFYSILLDADDDDENDDEEDCDNQPDEVDDGAIRINDDDDDVYDNYNDGDQSYIDHPSTSGLKRPSDGFSTRKRCHYPLQQ